MRAAAAAVLLLALCGTGCGEPPRQWSIGLYRGTTPFDLSPRGPNRPSLPPTSGSTRNSWPIPSCFGATAGSSSSSRRGDRGTEQGDIAWAERDAAGAWRYSGVALDEPFHLSYPFVFEHEGEVFMIPESRVRREVRLYFARPFPGRFELRRVLLSGKRYADSSLVAWQGHFYLFTSPDNGTLELFYADALEGPYSLIRAAPIVSGDDCAARPGGRPIVWQGRVFALPNATGRCMACPSGHSK